MATSNLFRLGAWLALVLAAVFFLTTGGTYPGIASVEGHVIGQVIAIAVLGGWLAASLARPAWRPRTPLLWPLALASAAYLASAVVSQRPRLSLEPTIAGLGWALAFLFLSRLLASDWFRARVAVVITAFTATIAFGYIVQVAIEWIAWWGLVGRIAVPPLRPSFAGLFLGSPNLIATALLLLAPLAVAMSWNGYRRKWFAGALGLASAIAIVLSGSRGAWLGAGFGVLVGFALVWTMPAARRSLASGIRRLRARPILLVPLAVVGAGALVLAPSLVQRFAQGGGTLRIDLWRSALAIFAEHPILGAGPGTWVQLKVGANPAGVPNLILPHAHDMYVQAAAELGVVGLLAGVLLVVAVARRVWKAWRAPAGDGGAKLSLQSAAVLVSLAAFAGQSVVDNLSNLPFVCLIVVTMVAWIDGGLATSETPPDGRESAARSSILMDLGRGRTLPVLGLVAFAVLIPTLVRIDRAASVAADGNRAAIQGLWQVALDRFDEARIADPGFTLYELQTAGALARVGRLAEARAVLAHAVEFDRTAMNVLGLAALEAELGAREEALAHVREAIALAPGEVAVALNAGLIAEDLGDSDFAVQQFALAVALDPPVIGSGLWEATTNKDHVVDRARHLVDDLEAALILAYAGDPGGARSELEQLPVSSRRDVYIAATEWLAGAPAIALARLDRMLQANPHDWFAAAWAGRIGRIAMDSGAQNRFSRWALAVQADAAPSVIGELSVVPAAYDAPSANLPWAYPWAVYLRPVAPFLLMPQLVLIGTR